MNIEENVNKTNIDTLDESMTNNTTQDFSTAYEDICMTKLDESILLEKSRQDLINKSKSGADYKSKDRRGTNRWDRRTKSKIYNSVRDYNDIDMNDLFKKDTLKFVVKVHGETDDYKVTLIFDNIMRNIQEDVKRNNNKLDFRSVLQALLRSFNSGDIYIGCDCPDFRYRFSHHATEGGYSSVMPELRPNRFDRTNKDDNMGSACKHVNLVIANLDWMMKIASVINNYIKYCQQYMQKNYADYIFPQVYGMPYNKAVQLSIFDDPDDNGLLQSDQDTISQAIEIGMRGKDEKGRWTKGNEFRFQKKEPKPDTSQEDENALNLKFEKEPEEDKEENIRI